MRQRVLSEQRLDELWRLYGQLRVEGRKARQSLSKHEALRVTKSWENAKALNARTKRPSIGKGGYPACPEVVYRRQEDEAEKKAAVSGAMIGANG